MHRKTHQKTTLCPACLHPPHPSDVTEGELPSAHLVEAEVAKGRGAQHVPTPSGRWLAPNHPEPWEVGISIPPGGTWA